MNKMLPKSLFFAITSFSLLFYLPATVLAETDEQVKNWYTIEVISFTRNRNSQIKERWLATPSQSETENPVLDNVMAIQPVSANEWKLSPHAYSLGTSPELKIQSHQACRQAGLVKAEAPWIKLQTESGQLQGNIRISLSRYLHADIDIRLANPDWSPSYFPVAEQHKQQQSETISFRASRRLKRDELHYIDHPLAGVLIRIERYEKPGVPTEPVIDESIDTPVSKEPNSAI